MKQYEEYRDSNIEWLGNIPKHWNVIRIKDKFNVVCGATPKEDSKNWDGEIIWIAPSDMEDFGEISHGARTITSEGYYSCGTTLVPQNSIILSTRAPIGKTNICLNEVCTNQGCKCLVPLKVNPKYYLYMTWNCKYAFQALGKGTTFIELSTKDLANFLTVLPPLTEQTAIANYLDEKTAQIDSRIALLNRKAELYRELRRSLINTTVTHGLNPKAPTKPSNIDWLGEIPQHWEKRRIKDLFQYGMNSVQDIPENTYIALDNIESFTGKITEYKSNIDNEELTAFQKDDILLNKLRPYLAKVFYCSFEGGVAGEILVMKAKKDICSKYFFYRFLSNNFIFKMNSLSKGVKMPRTNPETIMGMEIPLPPLKEQIAIANYLDEKTTQIDNIISQINQQTKQLAELRRSLIDNVVTGKIKITED